MLQKKNVVCLVRKRAVPIAHLKGGYKGFIYKIRSGKTTGLIKKEESKAARRSDLA
jgi:hypothetical protein